MAAVPIFHGHVDEHARLNLSAAEAPLRRLHLRNLSGKNVEIVIRKERTQRSLDQNGYWHAVPFPMLAEKLGYESLEELKYDLMGECWGWHYSKVAQREVPIKPSTSSMSMEEGAKFTDWLIVWAMTKWNIDIPPPEKAEGG